MLSSTALKRSDQSVHTVSCGGSIQLAFHIAGRFEPVCRRTLRISRSVTDTSSVVIGVVTTDEGPTAPMRGHRYASKCMSWTREIPHDRLTEEGTAA